MKKCKKIIFLDIDGVVCLYETASLRVDKLEYSFDACKRVRKFAELWGAQIVIMSDRRRFAGNGFILDHEPLLQNGFHSLNFHNDIQTPVLGQRSEEVQSWLDEHPEVEDYLCLEDMELHFASAEKEMVDNLIICDTTKGFTTKLYEQAKEWKVKS